MKMFKREIGNTDFIRVLNAKDATELFQLIDKNRQHLKQWMPWLDSVQHENDTHNFIERGLARMLENNGFELGIWHNQKIAGVIGLHYVSHLHRHTEIGYWLGQEFVGQGLVTRACKALIEYCFIELKLNKVMLGCACENKRSCSVAERLGFTYEGTLRQNEWLYDHFVDHKRYSLLVDEWEKKNKAT